MFFEVSVNLISRKQGPDTHIPRVTSSGEAERRRDAWIPMEKTRQVLVAKATIPTGTYKPDIGMLTMPGVLLDEDIEDEMGEPIVMCCREAKEGCKRGSLTPSLTPNERRLKDLVQMGAFGAAINHTAMLLTLYGQGRGRQGHPTIHTPQTLQLWYIRLALLLKTKSFAVAQAEAHPFSQLEKPDIFYQYYPESYGNRTGSMATFSFRLLLAELPMHCGKPKDSLRRLFCMWAAIKKMLNNLKGGFCEDGSNIELSEADRADSLKLWSAREAKVVYSIINCACSIKDYGLAMELLGQLIKRDEPPKHVLLSALGRLNLQTGNIGGAEVCFNEAYLYGSSGVRELVDRGLLAIAQKNYEEACTCFQRASALDPSNIMILNNLGVCMFYDGRIKEAIALLEAAIASNPVNTLHESIVLNLCSLYDLQSSKKGIMKKFALLRQISKYSADAPTTILEKLYG
ncbi:trafficking protein particle complex subunit 12-like [Euwallacea similis]|uniref:trafficking protein particle complex subunit 12-like n=1 Tax=Euwallacea similis TaxID=1736056 RepID=UPI00344DAB3C